MDAAEPAPRPEYSEDGVDLTLIRRTRSPKPAARLQFLEEGACDGACPRGAPASEVVRDTMYADGYGDCAMGRSRFRALPAAVRQVRCADCTACAVRCRNGVRVRERLLRAQELFGEPGRTA